MKEKMIIQTLLKLKSSALYNDTNGMKRQGIEWNYLKNKYLTRNHIPNIEKKSDFKSYPNIQKKTLDFKSYPSLA